ncbi:exonuclease domain-containing protein [Belliella pelovolcani]|uniref:DNA polymerase-3 subunit epsilon n=1 Tax=Belliella pelovolcani TaxID=529505 RepID=A0A1N7NRI4_9BACT|nr:exonuclease domain-containing protein [Belliella pelovolcani]SIT00921.1 DNA polymerase-3 subunit epsilon [Belliella pelovolcani]
MLGVNFAIVDIETAGGNPSEGLGITEIAILIHNGNEITETYNTLINPETYIPGYITGLTGINSDMVAQSPTFRQIARKIYEMLHDKVFIAHNVNFDYTFIQKALAKEGYELRTSKICTVRLSRKAFPGYKSYSLGRICEPLGIYIEDRHRAYGDAKATAILFDKILKRNPELIHETLKKNNGESFLPPNICKEKYSKIPEKTGVYYFYDVNHKVIYIGKANNIKSRFKSHFSGSTKGKLKMDLKNEIHDISWLLTGSEMLAYFLELQEIKKNWPKYNKSMKFTSQPWGVIQYQDSLGYVRFQVSKITPSQPAITQFENHADAWKFLNEAISEYELCPKLSGVQKSKSACYDFEHNKCRGACCNQEKPEQYNIRVNQWLEKIANEENMLIIKTIGRSQNEEAALFFENGMFSGHTFIEKELNIHNPKELLDMIHRVKPYQESKFILRSYLPKIKLDSILILK